MMNDRQRMTKRAAAWHAVTAASLAFALAACSQSTPGARADADPVATPAAPVSALGSYLAARHAQQERDYPRAA
jgi:hypothetical protein